MTNTRLFLILAIFITIPVSINAASILNYKKKHYLSIYGGRTNNTGPAEYGSVKSGGYASYKEGGLLRSFSIGYGYDFSDTWSFETRYSNLGRTELVAEIGTRYNVFYAGRGGNFVNRDNKSIAEVQAIDFLFRRNYLFTTFKYGRLNLFYSIGMFFMREDTKFHDGAFKRIQTVYKYGPLLTPIAGIYRINDNFQISYGITLYFRSDSLQLGIQYYFI